MELFFDETNPDSVTAAKALCAVCPLQEPCLEVALIDRIQDGVWGGLDPKERRQLRRDAERAARRRNEVSRTA